jgi:hypothetical protein
MITRLMAVALALIAAAGIVFGAVRLESPRQPAAVTTPVTQVRHSPAPVVGIVVYDLNAFEKHCSCEPEVAVHYVHWGQAPSMALAKLMISDGSGPLLELEPFGVSLASIAAGHEDAYLRRYAAAVKSLRTSVRMSFAPEANGNWYGWGHTHVAPATEVAAWRHVVRVFRKAGATNVTWIWIANTIYRGSGRLAALWPGSAYVNEVGIDGYFLTRVATFDSVFGPTLRDIRAVTDKPVLITETAAPPVAGQVRVLDQLASALRAYRLAGFIWFDIDQAGQRGLGKADWSMDANAAAVARYGEIVQEFR